jgi:hypothetical protein
MNIPASEIELFAFIHISARPLTHLGDLSAWKQAEGAILLGQRKQVIGTIASVREAKFNSDGIEIDIVKDGVLHHISPRNLISFGVLAIREGSTSFSQDLLDKALFYKRVQERARRSKETAARMSEVLGKLRRASVLSIVTAPAFTSEDFAVCLKWANKDPSKASIKGMLGQVDSYNALRLLSARAAELAAIRYYRNLGCAVEDVSVLQVGKKDDRWVTHDLMVDDHPVDVKNARRSFNSRHSYVEHCIPRFKETRDCGEGVAILGVLSDYLNSPILTEGKTQCQILGEVRYKDIQKLKSWAHRKYGAFMDIEGLWKPEYQPGWVFEYPSAHYRERPALLESMTEQLRWLLKEGCQPDEVEGVLLALSNDREAVDCIPLAGDRAQFLSDLREIDREVGYSRPALFLFVMGKFLEAIYKRTDITHLAATFMQFLFVRPDLLGSASEERVDDFVRGADSPLGLLDPSAYVFNLINALEAAAKECIERGYRFIGFQMRHPSILRGSTIDGKTITLLAFCGGWTTHPTRAKCGNSPLYLGANHLCPSCGYLICDKCGFCSRACVMNRIRQEEEMEARGGDEYQVGSLSR